MRHDVVYHIESTLARPHYAECSCGWSSIRVQYGWQVLLIVDAHLELEGAA